MSGKQLQKYILTLPHEERINLLQNNNIRDKFLEEENHYPFVWLIQGLEEDELKYFIDDKYLEKILNDATSRYKIEVIMTSGNKYATDVLLNDNALKLILNERYNLSDYISNLNYKIGQKIIDYSIKKDGSYFYAIGNLSKEEQLKVFSNDYIIKLLQCDNLDLGFICSLHGDVINKLIIYDKFLKLFIKLRIDQINQLVREDFIIPKRLFNNEKLIQKYINCKANRYREYINNLLINNFEFVSIIEEKRLKYIDKKINNSVDGNLYNYQDYLGDNSRLYDEFNWKQANYLAQLYIEKDYETLDKELKKISEKEILEYIIDTFFKDISYNFFINLKAILEYKKENKKFAIKNLDFYLKIMNFYNLSNEERIQLFNKYKHIDLAPSFYENYRQARDFAYENINDNLLKLDKDQKCYDLKSSKKYGTDIYYLDGEDFYLMIHSSSSGKWFNYNKGSNMHYVHETIFLSLISHDNINCFNSHNDIIFGFNKLKVENIMHVSNTDSFSSHKYGTNKIQKIKNAKELMDETVGYNEILYSEHNLDNFKPDFIISFDNITQEQLEVSLDMNIPIVVINSKKYDKKSGLESNYLNTYKSASFVDSIERYDLLSEEDINFYSK